MTAQVHEIMIYEGQYHKMATVIEIPENHPRIQRDDAFFSRNEDEGITMIARPAPEVAMATVTQSYRNERYPLILYSTACWRRYIGTWEIKDGRLYLINIIGKFKLIGDDPLFVDWFSGEIKIPLGDMLKYVHQGFFSVFEKERIVSIEKGIVKEVKEIDNRKKSKTK